MHLRLWIASIIGLGWIQCATCTREYTGETIKPSEEFTRSRGPDIFNSIHHAGRQWGSSLHHNGMSFFLATVPEGVLLYHGNRSPATPKHPDWLAYEIEHAEIFARGRQREGKVEYGYLHAYKTSRPMRLLYVDGTSGGTTNMGTLDSQDYILRGQLSSNGPRNSPLSKPALRWTDPVDEVDLADDLCKLAMEWNLQGVLRMEAGFEIIKCDFSDGLEEVQALQRPYGGKFSPDGIHGNLEFLRGVSERYDGIGLSRMTIDYSSMVSAFFFPVNLTNPDPERPDLPRLVFADKSKLTAIKQYLKKVINQRADELPQTLQWQDISDLIVGRYADRIQFMAEKVNSLRVMGKEVNFLLTIFIDYSTDDPNISAAINRCESFYLQSATPITEADHLIYTAFRSVTHEICTTLFSVRELVLVNSMPGQSSLEASKDILRELMEFLRWTCFKRCPPCPLDQVCVLPMWPLGTVEEYKMPRCSTGKDHLDAVSYWGLGTRRLTREKNNDDQHPQMVPQEFREGPRSNDKNYYHIREL